MIIRRQSINQSVSTEFSSANLRIEVSLVYIKHFQSFWAVLTFTVSQVVLNRLWYTQFCSIVYMSDNSVKMNNAGFMSKQSNFTLF